MIFMKEDIDKERQEAEKNKLFWKQRSVSTYFFQGYSVVCIQYNLIQISCPVCRSTMKPDELEYLNKLRVKNNINLHSNKSDEVEVVITNKMRSLQEKMKILYEKQKNAGGIIDIDKKEEIIILTVIAII